MSDTIILPNGKLRLLARAGESFVHKFGENPDIDSDKETIWPGDGDYPGWNATGAETVEVFSSAGGDASGNVGAETLEVYGCDSNYEPISETITLTGATPATSTNSYLRLDRAVVRSAGSSGANVGNITVRQSTTTANVFAIVPIGANQTLQAVYTIRKDRSGAIESWFASLSGKTSATCTIELRARPLGEVFQVKERFSIGGTGSSAIQRTYSVAKGVFQEGTDLEIRADTDTVNTAVSAGMDIVTIHWKG